MQLCNIDVGSSLQELTTHGTHAFPLAVYRDELSKLDGRRVPWHWHPEVEMAVGLRGRAVFHIGGGQVTLGPGEGIFVNANVLHKVERYDAREACVFRSMVADPVLVSGHSGSAVGQKYVQPLLQCTKLPYVHFGTQDAQHTQLSAYIQDIIQLCEQSGEGYELAARNTLGSFWAALFTLIQPVLHSPAQKPSADDARIRAMLQFIQAHYAEKITLAGIAASAGLSASECCRCFTRVLGLAPIAYLTQYRLGQAAGLLVATDEPVADIGHAVGFSAPSYFARQFARVYGCTPSSYRAKHA